MHLGLVADIVVLGAEWQISVSGDKISHPSLGYASTGICDIVSPLTEICHSGTDTSNIIQLLTGDEGNIWYVGPEDKMLPEAEGRGQHFVWRSNISYVARIPSQ